MVVSAELMERLKSCELEMLKVFIKICDQLNLKYYLVEGTLLGAVRHKGFIPWDDDIDVGMPRDDYDRFLKEAQQYFPSHYFIQSIQSEPEYHTNFAKIRDNRTTFIESSVKNQKINHGVYIDIFPIDYAFEDKKQRKILKAREIICTRRISQVFSVPQRKRRFYRQFISRVFAIYAKCKYPEMRQAVLAREKLYTELKSSKLVTNYGSAWGDKEIMPVEWYGEGVFLEFEGLSVRVPTEYDKWLSQVYGNYMQFPSPEKRVPHHYAEVIDPDRPYTEYINKVES